jgi:hypothetical protein
MLTEVIAGLPAGHRGYRAIQALPGTGPVLAAVTVAEIGDLSPAVQRKSAYWPGFPALTSVNAFPHGAGSPGPRQQYGDSVGRR